MKKFSAYALSVCLTAVLLAQVAVFAAQGGYINTTVRLRNEPKQDAKSSSSIYVGSRVSVISKSGDWCKVEYKGETGYVKTKYVTEDKAGGSAKKAQPSKSENTPGKATSGVGTLKLAVKFRTEAKQDSKYSTVLYPGYRVQVLSTSDGWCKCVYKNSTGYIKQDYLYVNDGAAGSGALSGTATLRVAVKFRLQPKDDAKYDSKLYPGYEVRVLSSSDGWCKVEYGGHTGYVRDKYLNFAKAKAAAPAAPAAPAAAKPESGIGRVRVAVRFRKDPSQNAPSVAIFYPGDELRVLSTSAGWCKCEYKGATGYIKADYLDIRGAAVSESAPKPTPGSESPLTPEDTSFRGTSTAKFAIRFRNAAADGAASKYTLYPGDKFFVLKKLGSDWALCEYNGTQGYVRVKYIDLKNEAFKSLTEASGTPIKTLSVNAEKAYLKLGPGYDNATVRTLALNESVKVYEETGDWYRVITEKNEGGYIPKNTVG